MNEIIPNIIFKDQFYDYKNDDYYDEMVDRVSYGYQCLIRGIEDGLP
jgi:hypothetical protein